MSEWFSPVTCGMLSMGGEENLLIERKRLYLLIQLPAEMKLKLICLIFFLLTFFNHFNLFAQVNWVNYTDTRSLRCMASDSSAVWMGSDGGLVKIDLATGAKTFFNKGNSGIPDDFINDIRIKNGIVWVASNSGVAKFDGATWTTYNMYNSGLPGKVVNSIAIQDNGTAWMSVPGSGLVRFDGTSWISFNTSNSSIPTNDINGTSNFTFQKFLAVDKNNCVWLGTWGYGVVKFDGSSWMIFNTSNSGLTSNFIYQVRVDTLNSIWLSVNSHGVFKFDGALWTIYNSVSDSIPDAPFYIETDAHNNIWVAFWSWWEQNAITQQYEWHEGGLYKFDGNNWTNYHRPAWPSQQDNVITCFTVPSSAEIWAYAENIVYQYDFSLWQPRDVRVSGLDNNNVSALAVDTLGNKWLACEFSSIEKFDDNVWTLIGSYDSTQHEVNSLAIAPTGNLWVSYSYSLPLYKYQYVGIPTWINQNQPSGYSINADSSNNVWVPSYQVLSKFNGTMWTTWNYTLSNTIIWGVDFDIEPSGIFWLAANNSGIEKYDGNTWTIYKYLNAPIPNTYFTRMKVDRNNNKWIGSRAGLIKYDDVTWTVYDTTNSPLPSNIITELTLDTNGLLWIGTDNGMISFDGSNWNIYNTFNSGLAHNSVKIIVVDKYNNKWIGTWGGGLCAFNENGVILNTPHIILDNSSLIVTYPNPFTEQATISIPSQLLSKYNLNFILYDLTGRQIKFMKNINSDIQISQSNLSKGLYLFKIFDTNGAFVFSGKLIAN